MLTRTCGCFGKARPNDFAGFKWHVDQTLPSHLSPFTSLFQGTHAEVLVLREIFQFSPTEQALHSPQSLYCGQNSIEAVIFVCPAVISWLDGSLPVLIGFNIPSLCFHGTWETAKQ